MKKSILTTVSVLFVLTVFAQVNVVLQNGSKTEVYTDIQAAITAAVAGDTIYLPGLGFPYLSVDKKLHWIGTGHYPAATAATGVTTIGGMRVLGNADGSSFEGIDFTGGVAFGNSSVEANGTVNDCTNIAIKRCRFRGILYLRQKDIGTPNLDFVISESVIDSDVEGREGTNVLFKRCIIKSFRLKNIRGSQFSYNIMMLAGGSNTYHRQIYRQNSVLYDHNIFTCYYRLYESSSLTFNNNVFNSTLPYAMPNTSGITGTGNIINVDLSTLFQQIQNNDYCKFDYANDYHFKTGVSAAIKQTGIYGDTNNPYKEEAVPFYPSITAVAIDAEADAASSTLSVKITAEGQDR